MNGKFIVIEGPDGVGKTTIINGLKEHLPEAVFIREPGNSKFGNEIRKILLHKNYKLETMTEIMLFFASFIETSKKIIEPALDKGKIIIADRWYYSTLAYQGYTNHQDDYHEIIKNLIYDLNGCNYMNYDLAEPNKTLILMAKKSVIEQRKNSRDIKKDNIESRSKEYLDNVYGYYKNFCRGTIINVNGTLENNIKKVLKEIKR